MNNLTLLYVEDDSALRESFGEILARYFNCVLIAEDGKQALKLYENNKIDVAILDISLPYVSGLEIASRIREDGSTIPIIMFSAHTEQDKLLTAANLQIYAYLVKPVTYENFNKTILGVIASIKQNYMVPLNYGFSWDEKAQELLYENQIVKITKNEKKLLSFLCANPRSYFKACELEKELFNAKEADDTGCNNLVQLISRFKSKIKKTVPTEDFFISNVYGLGYSVVIK